jgi:signal transduction histidine kinase
MLGYARDEYVGHKIEEFHVDPERIADMLARLHAGRPSSTRRDALQDGSRSTSSSTRGAWDEGRFVHTQCFTRDVTDRVRADAEREEANCRKDEFMAILGHELRNRSARSGMQRTPAAARLLGSDARRSVGMIERQVAQMARLLDDLLDVSRLSRGTLELRRTRFALGEVVGRAVDTAGTRSRPRGRTSASRSLRVVSSSSPTASDSSRSSAT